MTGYCPDCGNTLCICDIGEYEKPRWVPKADYARLEAENAALREAGDRIADYVETLVPGLDTRHQRADVRELIDAWRAMATPSEQREGEAP